MENSTEKIYFMFHCINLIEFCKYMLVLDLMPATCFKPGWDKRLVKLWTAPLDCVMIEYELKGSVVHKQGSGKVQHFVKHVTV